MDARLEQYNSALANEDGDVLEKQYQKRRLENIRFKNKNTLGIKIEFTPPALPKSKPQILIVDKS